MIERTRARIAECDRITTESSTIADAFYEAAEGHRRTADMARENAIALRARMIKDGVA